MSDPYIGEIRMFAGNYAPEGWTICDGKTLQINSYQALFSLIGTTYGGDGSSVFAVPDFRGRLPVGQGQGTGLTSRTVGQKGGVESVVLTKDTMSAHTHAINAVNTAGTQTSPQGGVWASTVNTTTSPVTPVNQYVTKVEIVSPSKLGTMDSVAIGKTGYDPAYAHSNVMPSLPLNFIIALQGEFPQKPNN